MLLVKEVEGPHRLRAGEEATYRVKRFNEANPGEERASRVSWLVKTEEGVALTNIAHVGPVWTITVPASWAGCTIYVMPYMNSATYRVSVRTAVDAPLVVRPPEGAVRIEVFKENRRYYASVNDEPRFYVGTDVSYGSRRGLMNSGNPYGPRYDPVRYEAQFGHWARYLLPTITCESRGAFSCINTYDRARFTFGHMQFAAHTPDENFVLLFRELLGLPDAARYFGDLLVVEGRIHRMADGTMVPLEGADETGALQDYLNPDPYSVAHRSVEIAAGLMDWCARDPAFPDRMAVFAFLDQQRKLRYHARKLPLDGLSDKLCLVVLDILHQGRGRYTLIREALRQDDPFDALLGIGASRYRERIATLRAGILELERAGVVGHRSYDAASGDFVPADGA